MNEAIENKIIELIDLAKLLKTLLRKNILESSSEAKAFMKIY